MMDEDANRPRVSESIQLLIQIDRGCVTKKPNVRINHRDEELPMPNVRIGRTVCTDQLLVKESNIDNLRIQ